MTSMRFEPARGLSGELRAPPDKSISHRAALLGAMAPEPVRIEHIDIIGLPAKPKPGAKTGTRKAGTKSGAKTKPGAAPPPK